MKWGQIPLKVIKNSLLSFNIFNLLIQFHKIYIIEIRYDQLKRKKCPLPKQVVFITLIVHHNILHLFTDFIIFEFVALNLAECKKKLKKHVKPKIKD